MEKKVYIRHSAVSTRTNGEDGAALFHADTGLEKFINRTGLFVWKRLDGCRTPAVIAQDLVDGFDSVSADQVLGDVVRFCGELRKEKFADIPAHTMTSSSETAAFPDMSDGPTSMDISITGMCNQKCIYCYYADEMLTRQDLSTESWLTFIDELGALAVRDVLITGGEVFLREGLWAIIDRIIQNRMRFSISTNGTLISASIIEELAKKHRKIRFDNIKVSIDGSCAEIHDKSRGKGSFTKAVKGLRLLKEAGFPVSCRVTVNRFNVDDLPSIARLLLEDIGLQSFGTNDVIPMGAGCSNLDTISLLPYQYEQAMRILYGLFLKYKGRVAAQAGPLANKRVFKEMEKAKETGTQCERWQMGYLTACRCSFEKLSVHNDGTISPCTLITRAKLGRINEETIESVWKTSQILHDMKNRGKIPMNEVEGCEKCEWAPFCNGGCPAVPFNDTGNLISANPRSCYRRFQDGGTDWSSQDNCGNDLVAQCALDGG